MTRPWASDAVLWRHLAERSVVVFFRTFEGHLYHLPIGERYSSCQSWFEYCFYYSPISKWHSSCLHVHNITPLLVFASSRIIHDLLQVLTSLKTLSTVKPRGTKTLRRGKECSTWNHTNDVDNYVPNHLSFTALGYLLWNACSNSSAVPLRLSYTSQVPSLSGYPSHNTKYSIGLC